MKFNNYAPKTSIKITRVSNFVKNTFTYFIFFRKNISIISIVITTNTKLKKRCCSYKINVNIKFKHQTTRFEV